MTSLLHALGLAFLAASSCGASAQDFHNRPVRIIVGTGPGAPHDTIARIIGPKLSIELGQPVVVENKPGAGSMIGARAAIQAPADGHTLLIASLSIITNSLVYKSAGYKMSDLTTVAPINGEDWVFWIRGSLPARNLGEFVAYAKANPGRLSVGTLGPAAVTSIVTERFKRIANIQLLNVPYSSGPTVVTALVSGTLDACLACAQTGQAKATIALGLRPLATTGEQRSASAPEIPTFKEQGYPEMVVKSWGVAFARSDTPAPILSRLRGAMDRVLADPLTRAQIQNSGLSVSRYRTQGSPGEFDAKFSREIEEWRAIVKESGLQLE